MMAGAKRYLALIALTFTMLILAACSSRSTHERQTQLDFQSQLAALQAPQGVDPAVFAQLKDELARQLAERGKITAAAPTGIANTPANVHFTDEGGGNYALRWEYRNIGDYDQNGVVGVTDITPIAMHFGHAVGTDPLDAVIDGDGNGTIGIADVTPLAMNFGVEVAHYVVKSSDAEDGTYSTWMMLPFSDGTGGTDGWKDFSAVSDYIPLNWFRAYPEDQYGARGQVSPAIQLGGGGTAPIITEVLPLSGMSAASYSPIATNTGGAATSASWDFGGGAIPNITSDISPTVTLTGVGTYLASVTLTNGSGSDTFDFTLTVTSPVVAWQYFNIYSSTSIGNYISFAFIDGLPAFAYVDTNDGTLHYSRATIAVPQNPADWVDMLVDTNPAHWYDGEVSLIVDNYLTPIILAYNSANSAAMYIGSDIVTPSGPGDWVASVVRQPVDEAGSLVLAQGSIFATYRTPGGLFFAEATTYPPVDASSWVETSVDSSLGAGASSRIKYNGEDGRFYIVAYNLSNTELFMSHCLFDDRATPASWVTFVISGEMGMDEGAFFDFAFDPASLSDNLFCIYHRDYVGTTGTMGVLGHEGAPNNSGFDRNGILYQEGTFQGEYCSLAFEENLLAFSYNRTTPADLMVAVSPFTENQTPLGWVYELVPDPSASLIRDTNLLIHNGDRMMIVYGREDGIYFATATLQ